MSPRTLWVTNDFPPQAGGIEQFLSGLLAELDPATVRVLASKGPGWRAHDPGLPYRVDRIARPPLLPTRRLAETVRAVATEHGADVVVFGAAWPLAEIAGALERPTFALTHGHEAGLATVGAGRLVRRALRDLDAVGVISDYTRRALQPWTAGTPLVWLPPGVDTDRFHPDRDGDRVRERYRIGADQPLVVCLSRLVRRKGQDTLVEAWPEVVERVGPAHLLLVGGGPRETALRCRVRDLGLGRRLTVTGPVTPAALPDHHAAADLFAMPCRTRWGGLDVEGLGIVYLEAQASGVPVVAGASGGAPSALRPGATGLVVDGDETAGVADAVVALLTNAERRAEMGRRARAFVLERYAWPVIGQRLDAVLDALAGGGKADVGAAPPADDAHADVDVEARRVGEAT